MTTPSHSCVPALTVLLEDLVAGGGYLFFTHDPTGAAARLQRDDKGRVVAGEQLAERRDFAARTGQSGLRCTPPCIYPARCGYCSRLAQCCSPR